MGNLRNLIDTQRCTLSKQKWDILEGWVRAEAVNQIVFVDGDNVQLIWEKMIENLIPQETIFIFCCNSVTKVTAEHLPEHLKIWIYDDIKKVNNSADIALSYLFGALDRVARLNIEFAVISGDQGFQALETRHLVRQGEDRNKRIIKVIDSHRFKGKEAALTEQVCTQFFRRQG